MSLFSLPGCGVERNLKERCRIAREVDERREVGHICGGTRKFRFGIGITFSWEYHPAENLKQRDW